MKSFIVKIFILKFIVISTYTCFGQKINLGKLVSTNNQFEQNHAPEKIYIHTDKPNYIIEDTLWFKVYLLDGAYYSNSNESKISYIEIANDSNVVVKRIMIPVTSGISYGNIFLNEKEFRQGGYILRAYTNWMRNFKEDIIFEKRFYINNFKNNDWLIDYAINQQNSPKKSYSLNLQVKNMEGNGVILQDLEVVLTGNKKRVFKEKIKTDIDGNIHFDFTIPNNFDNNNLIFTIQDMQNRNEGRTYNFPLILNFADDIDLQFMPESGQLLNGIPSKVGFKAINSLGLGVDVAGELYEEGNSKMLFDFESSYNGIGAFNFTPIYGKNYFVKLKSLARDGASKTFPVPLVQKEGLTIAVDNHNDSDSLNITIRENASLPTEYYFIAQARNLICYASKLNVKNGITDFKLDKKLLPSGVTSLIVLNQDKEILNRRLVYVDHQDDFKIDFIWNKVNYQQRDSVSLTVKVSDKTGLPVSGNFSLSVTDDFFVKQDSLKYNSIPSYMNLSSNLKGNIENVGYYANAIEDKTKWRNLDNLLLTQGWANYFPEKITETKKDFDFEVEKEFLITGKVTNAFDKRIIGSDISLFSKKPLLVASAKTDSLGRFCFKNIFPVDTAIFFIQAKNKRDKSFNVGIEMDEFAPPLFTEAFTPFIPLNINIDTEQRLNIKQKLILNNDKNYKLFGNVLKEVLVSTKKAIPDSKNLNGAGQSDLVLDQSIIEKAGKITLGDLIKQKIPGVYVASTKSGNRYYKIRGKILHIIIDGMDINFFMPETNDLSRYFDEYFNHFTAEDIKGIELMYSGQYGNSYVSQYLGLFDTSFDHAFLEITTRGGRGPFIKKTAGTYLFKPLAFSLPNQFYSPKYTFKDRADMTDLRSTIYWNPNFETDENGIAKLSFYTSDHLGSYSIHLEGTNKTGFLGTKRGSIKNIAREQ